jgi:hypothetical protein
VFDLAPCEAWAPHLVNMQFNMGAKTNTVKLCVIKHAPDMPNNLINVGHLTDKDNTVTFTSTGVELFLLRDRRASVCTKMKVQVT